MPNATVKIDFESWSKLAQDDPDAFEARRVKAIQALIETCPDHQQQRLSCLQWRVDQVRERAKTPLAGCLRMSKMMWDRVLGKGGLMTLLDQLSIYSKAYPKQPNLNYAPPQKAQVLSLNQRKQTTKPEKIARI